MAVHWSRAEGISVDSKPANEEGQIDVRGVPYLPNLAEAALWVATRLQLRRLMHHGAAEDGSSCRPRA